MYKRKICFILILISTVLCAQEIEGLRLPTPGVNVSLGIGFNYDYLKSPLDVDLEGAKGFYSVNIPIKFTIGEDIIDQLFSDASRNFTDGEYFMPNMSARQFANTTIKVDVPMLWGVCSFSHINVMSMKYENMTGIPNFRYSPNMDNLDMLLLGNINTPFNFSLGWESMTFGYMYKLNDLASFAFNLHRHRFYFRLAGNIDINVYGRVHANMGMSDINVPVKFALENPISGEYSLERWTPTFAARFWRFDLMARIMFKNYAKGALSGNYEVPFFVDESNFTFKGDLSNQDYVFENIKDNSFVEGKTNFVNLRTNKDMQWRLPSVLTLKYEIIPNHLWASYSKFIGKTLAELVDDSFGNENEFLANGVDFRLGVNLDHLILFNGRLGWFYGSVGIMSVNADFQNQRNLLDNYGENFLVPYGKGVMLPTLSGGGIIGTKLQVLLELNLLPLTAFKTGLVYNF